MNKKIYPVLLLFYLSVISAVWLFDAFQKWQPASVFRIILTLAIAAITLAFSLGFLYSAFASGFRGTLSRKIENLLTRPRGFWTVFAVSSTVFVLSGYAAANTQLQALLGGYQTYFLPLASWTAVAAGGLVIFLLSWQADWSIAARWRSEIRIAIFVFLAMLAIWAGIAISRIGLRPDVAWWSEPGTPILIGQALLAWAIACLCLAAARNAPPALTHSLSPQRLDALIFIALWSITFIVWQSAPLRQDHFITQPVPPNYEYYPYSDARLYDLSGQQLLAGEGLSRNPATKPLYAAFLAFARFTGKQDYAKTVAVQTAALSIIPALLFLLTKSLGSRPAGIAAALMALFRERNSILLTDIIKVSNTKMLMTDVPAMAAMLLIAILIVLWMQKPQKRAFLTVLIGSAMGIFSLLRGQILFVAPLVLLFIVFIFRHRIEILKLAVPAILGGIALSLLPWLAWKGLAAGQIGLKEALPYETNVAYKYTLVDTQCGTDESIEACNARARALFINFVWTQPGQVASFVTAHFFHNLIESVLYLPPSFRLEPLEDLVTRHPIWVYRWDGELPAETVLLLIINLALIALGIGTAWAKAKNTMLVPLTLEIGYILTVSLARISGYRFILPVDWVSLVFYSIGMVQATIILAAMVRPSAVQPASAPPPADQPGTKTERHLFILAGICAFAIGAILPLAEMLIPKRYPTLASNEQAVSLYQSLTAGQEFSRLPPAEAVSALLEQDDGVLLYGTALYPRYIRNRLKSNTDAHSPNLAGRDYLLFYIVGPQTAAVVLPLNSKPDSFPEASPVMLVGCQSNDGLADGEPYIEAKIVLLPQTKAWFLSPSARKDLVCP